MPANFIGNICRGKPVSRTIAQHRTLVMDEQHPEPQHIATDKARAGTTPHVVRYILAISLVLAIVAMMVIWGLAHHAS
jgi:hypothetical protein